MNILEAYDLTGSLRDAAELAGARITRSRGMSPGGSGAVRREHRRDGRA